MLPWWEVVPMILGKFSVLADFVRRITWKCSDTSYRDREISHWARVKTKSAVMSLRDWGIFLTWHKSTKSAVMSLLGTGEFSSRRESTKRAAMPLQGAGIFSSLPRCRQGELTTGAVMPFGRRVKFPSLRKPGKAFAWRLSWKEHANLQMAKQKVATTMLCRWLLQWCVQRPKHSADGADEAHSKSCYLLSQCYFCINL